MLHQSEIKFYLDRILSVITFTIDPDNGMKVGNEWLTFEGQSEENVFIKRAIPIQAMSEILVTVPDTSF
jgi:hypothetical protein